MNLEIKCKTCKHSYSNNGQNQSCMFHDTIYDGLMFCVNEGYKDWQQYIPELDNNFIEEREMII